MNKRTRKTYGEEKTYEDEETIRGIPRDKRRKTPQKEETEKRFPGIWEDLCLCGSVGLQEGYFNGI